MKIITVPIKGLCVAVAIICFFACKSLASDNDSASHQNKMFVKVTPFQTCDGWGYEIYTDNKLYIRQALIPGIAGKHSFASREDAIKVGELAMQKMASEHKLPFISKEDLQQMSIQLPDNLAK